MEQHIFHALLSSAVQHGVSDIHLKPGSSPAFRLRGDLVNVKSAPLTDEDLERISATLIRDPRVKARIAELQDYDGSFEVKGLARFRFNIFRHQRRLGVILRIVPPVVPSFEGLGLSPVIQKLAMHDRGLVLVTGATGVGKTSTLAAMIDFINSNKHVHIVTIEDPIEFVHQNKKARVTQREVGLDTGNFAGALRSALRQDPDVILVGEMRDAETIDVALKAAETGHLVLSTVHTTDAIKTIGRLVSVFPPEEQAMVRLRLADNLIGTVSQRLLKRADRQGLVAAQEIMVSNVAIMECIADPTRTGEINDFISRSKEISGAQTFDQHLVELYQKGLVTLVDAKEASTNASEFERNLMYGLNVDETTLSRLQKTDSVQLDQSVPIGRTGVGSRNDDAA